MMAFFEDFGGGRGDFGGGGKNFRRDPGEIGDQQIAVCIKNFPAFAGDFYLGRILYPSFFFEFSVTGYLEMVCPPKKTAQDRDP